ncbi:hypothetical protein MSHOH_2067 [Methanosarcina horonobensis HB-1 = JCM 15518]|uniref:Uncharacterized protein n=2 Tax=Methanosarcina horonobensis TaxID=418008 RepID=A0A0E3WVV7_9EURY|nr:hypothetical protein MSHOH_2067 [Methanosarcina horonobensis HB-1 = JCM 15518]
MLEKEDVEEIISSKMPFEYFVHNLASDADEKIFQIFRYGEPNTNHVLIAKLAKLGIVKTILTTNFDLLFEKALIKEGLEFVIHYDDDDFSKIDFKNKKGKLNLFKIHGSVERYDSLLNTVNKVGQGLTKNQKKIMDYVFLGGSHSKILVLGYSCSDKFDINPYLNNLLSKNKEVIFVKHKSLDEIISPKELTKIDVNNPFYNFDGICIKCNTDVFIKNLWKMYEKDIGNFIYLKRTVNWETHLKAWTRQINNNGVREIFAGKMFTSISNYQKAEKYFKKSIKISKRRKNSFGPHDCHLSLGFIFHMLHKLNEALFHYNKALEELNIYDNGYQLKAQRINCYVGIGTIYTELKDYVKAFENFNLAIKMYNSQEDSNLGVEANILMAIGNYYKELGDFDNALRNLKISLDIRTKNGELIGIARCYVSLGNLHKEKQPLESIEYFKKAMECFKELGMYNEVGICYSNLSAPYGFLNQVEIELSCLKEAEKIFVQLKNISNLMIVLNNIFIYASRENDHKLLKEYEEKINIVNSGKFYSLNQLNVY